MTINFLNSNERKNFNFKNPFFNINKFKERSDCFPFEKYLHSFSYIFIWKSVLSIFNYPYNLRHKSAT